MLSKQQNTGDGLYLLPFLIFFTIVGVAILQPGYGSRVQQDASAVNQIALSIAYLLAFILTLRQRGLISWILVRAVPLVILFFLTLISLFWSDFPSKVVISFIHGIGTVFIALCMMILLVEDKDKFFRLLLISLFIYILATIFVTLLRPDIGLMSSSNIYDVTLIGRWRGLTYHPNSLGILCLLTNWVALSTFFHTNNGKWVSLLAVITLISAFYCLYNADSMTSTLLSVALVFGIGWFSFIGNSSGGVKFIKIMLGLFALIIGSMVLYIFHPGIFTEKYFFHAIGRDASLSGRSSLWELGFKGFYAKPYFGWSYDGLRSFLKQYNLGYGQLHNGYLDFLVRGGLVSVFVFCALLFQFLLLLIRQAGKKNKDYVFILALMVMVLMHNMTEANILRNPNIIWLMFLVGYFYCLWMGRVQKPATALIFPKRST